MATVPLEDLLAFAANAIDQYGKAEFDIRTLQASAMDALRAARIADGHIVPALALGMFGGEPGAGRDARKLVDEKAKSIGVRIEWDGITGMDCDRVRAVGDERFVHIWHGGVRGEGVT